LGRNAAEVNEAHRIVFEATIDKAGHCVPAKKRETQERLARWRDRKVMVIVQRWRKPKTMPQLSYYFGPVIQAWAEHTGYELDEIHIELKRAYFPQRPVISKITGEERDELPSLADASSQEMSEYLDRVLREAAKLGLHIPSPVEWERTL